MITKMKLSLDDISISPSNSPNDIVSRSSIKITDDKKMLPLFTAPMSSIIDTDNINTFIDNGIYSILPRNIDISKRIEYFLDGHWIAVSLEEAKSIMSSYSQEIEKSPYKLHMCIDVANGHTQNLLTVIKLLKDSFKDKVKIMAGNIAHPYMYEYYAKVGCDYVRLGIGTGANCSTSVNSAIHYPMASLIEETVAVKRKIKGYFDSIHVDTEDWSLPKIVADGGCRNFDDIIKCIALGADYVMCGSLFTRFIESAGQLYYTINNNCTVDDNVKKAYQQNYKISPISFPEKRIEFCRKHYGMSTQHAQEKIKEANRNPIIVNKEFKVSEGFHTIVNVDYDIETWVKEFSHYLRTAISYTRYDNIDSFRSYTTCIRVSNSVSYNLKNK